MNTKKSKENSGEKQKNHQSGKKSLKADQWQDIVKFQQEIASLQAVEATQETKLGHLEYLLRKFQKNFTTQDVAKDEVKSHINFYLTHLEKLQEETNKMKAMCEKKIQTLNQLTKDTVQYVKSLKNEQKKYLSIIEGMNTDMMNTLEKLKKAEQENLNIAKMKPLGDGNEVDTKPAKSDYDEWHVVSEVDLMSRYESFVDNCTDLKDTWGFACKSADQTSWKCLYD